MGFCSCDHSFYFRFLFLRYISQLNINKFTVYCKQILSIVIYYYLMISIVIVSINLNIISFIPNSHILILIDITTNVVRLYKENPDSTTNPGFDYLGRISVINRLFIFSTNLMALVTAS